MWSAPVVVFLPFFQRLSGVVQCAEQCFVQAFISELAVKAFNETVLLGLCRRDVVPIDACILNPLQNCLAGELGAIARDYRFWHATLRDHTVPLTRNPLA